MLNVDRHIAIQAGWIAGPAFGVAMMAAPEYFHLGPIWSGVVFWGGIAVFLVTLAVVVALSLHEQRKQRTVLGPVLMMAIGALVFGGGAAWYFWPSTRSGGTIAIDTQPIVSSILFECQYGSLPSSPSRTYMLQLFPIPAENGGGGLSESFSLDGKSEMIWPKTASGFPVPAYKCQLTNYDPVTLIGVEFSLNLVFQKEIKDDTQPGSSHSGETFLSRKWPISITKIDPSVGNPFIFYIVNFTEHFVTVSLPDTGNAKRIDEQNSKPIRIIGPNQYFQMHFVPFHSALPEPHADTTAPPLPKHKPQTIPK